MRALICFAVTVLCLLSSCGESKAQVAADGVNSTPGSGELTTKRFAEGPVRVESLTSNIEISDEHIGFSPLPLHASAHEGFLKDELVFRDIPDQNVKSEKTAVIGSKVARFYPFPLNTDSLDLASLPKGSPIPFGTIIPVLGERIRATGGERGDMFFFEENWNWFYHTKIGGKAGIVFGADLYGVNDTPERNRISALLYNSNGKYENFYPITGYNPLNKQVASVLADRKLAFQNVNKSEYWLSAGSPDDMISLYSNNYLYANREAKVPTFVTTDLAAHAQHLVFDRLLQFLEEDLFMQRLNTLTHDLRTKIDSTKANDKDSIEAKQRALDYLDVVNCLIELGGNKYMVESEHGGGREVAYQPGDRDEILPRYNARVGQEIELIIDAKGRADSPIFSSKDAKFSEDYTQYKARGHYTKNDILGYYFKSMMWFGRMGFLFLDKSKALQTDYELSKKHIQSALFLLNVLKNEASLLKKWKDLFDPITALIGASDDLSYKELEPFISTLSAAKITEMVIDSKQLDAFIAEVYKSARGPAISGNSVFQGIADSSNTPPKQFRLFGQRFTVDSLIHHNVSPPRLIERDMVTGLDIMKAFGSQTANDLLTPEFGRVSGLKDALDKLEQTFGSFDQADWTKSFYNQVLFQSKAQAQFEKGTGLYFTESDAWNLKALNAGLGTWAELRHDTLLYVKQSYAERAGDGDFEPTFRTEKVPEPVHYLEPNTRFWTSAAQSVSTLFKILKKYDLIDDEAGGLLKRLYEIYVKCINISETEFANQPVSPELVAWIPTIPAELAHIVLIKSGYGDQIEEDQLKMAIIADVYTNAELGKVLEVGVGIPYRIFVPLNDSQGGKRIAVGYSFNYYEFAQAMDSRMTDEEWKTKAYSPDADLEKYKPVWFRGIAIKGEKTK